MRVGPELGGTITGEHGVGFLKRAWLPNELDEGSRRIWGLSRTLDLPDLNPARCSPDLRASSRPACRHGALRESAVLPHTQLVASSQGCDRILDESCCGWRIAIAWMKRIGWALPAG